MATNHMALKHKICVWSLKKSSLNSLSFKMCLKYFLLVPVFPSSLCIKKSWRSGLLQDETPELRSPIKEKKGLGFRLSSRQFLVPLNAKASFVSLFIEGGFFCSGAD